MRFLTDNDCQILQRWLDSSRGIPTNHPVGLFEENQYKNPETYVCVPTSDIPARDDGSSPPVAGEGQADIYRINDDGELVQLEGLTKTVYNVSDSDITSGSYHPVIRSKSGRWLIC